ncbi:MAG: DUF1015 domain-containing protein [Candidatus Zixiibacteriota bacterium]
MTADERRLAHGKDSAIRILPFSAWRYNPSVVGDPAGCVSPPYDQFTPEMIARLEAQSPYNIARMVKAPEGGGPDESGKHYQGARELLNHWIGERAIVADRVSGIYPYAQSYPHGNGRLTRQGFIALGDVRDAGLYTHEETHSHVREDRARLRLATAADFGLIFMIYSDPSLGIDRLLRDCLSGTPLLSASQPDGSTHHLHRCSDPDVLTRITRQMSGLDCVIADGHHRTAAAFDAWKRSGDDRFGFAMMAFFNADAPGMTVLPIHRGIVRRDGWRFESFLDALAERFDVQEIPVDPQTSDALIAGRLDGLVQDQARKERMAFGLVGPDRGRVFLLESPRRSPDDWPWPPESKPAWRQLATAVFDVGILRSVLGFKDADMSAGRDLVFSKDSAELIGLVRKGLCQAGFILPATPLGAIFEVARARQNLPQKSTFFFPKLLTGLTINRIDTLPAA